MNDFLLAGFSEEEAIQFNSAAIKFAQETDMTYGEAVNYILLFTKNEK